MLTHVGDFTGNISRCPCLFFHVSKRCLNHDGTLDTLLLHLTSNIIGTCDITCEVVCICITAAAAIILREAILTGWLCIYIALFKFIAYILLYNTIINISK